MTWEILPAEEFRHHHAPWQALNDANAGTQLLDAFFMEASLRHFGSGEERLGIFRDGGEITAMGLFAPAGRGAWQTFQSANAPLGAWVSAPGRPLEPFVKPLMGALPGLNALVGISQQDPDILAPPAGGNFGLLDYILTSRITITGSFEDYWMSRGKNLRHNIKRQRNRLTREEVATRLELVTNPGAMEKAVSDYADLESRGWKGEANTAVTGDDPQSRFYVEVLDHYGALGQAVVWRYLFNDVLAASDICVHRDGVLIILKTAYDESFKGYSPAQLMRHEAFQPLFDGGDFKVIEFYGPVKDWHTKWTDETRTMYHANYYRHGALKALHQRNKNA